VVIGAGDGPLLGGLRKLDAKGLTDLNAKFAGMFPKRVKAPASAPRTPPKVSAPAPAVAEAPEPVAQNPPAPAVAEAPVEAPAEAPVEAPAEPQAVVKTIDSKLSAWESVIALKRDDVPEDVIAEAWIAACTKMLGADGDEDTATPAQWLEIRNATLDQIPHSPF